MLGCRDEFQMRIHMALNLEMGLLNYNNFEKKIHFLSLNIKERFKLKSDQRISKDKVEWIPVLYAVWRRFELKAE